MTQKLEIETFGGLHIRLDNTAVSGLASRKADALLVYLACNPRRHAREALATLLWPDAPPPRSLGNLSVLLSSLRKQLAPFLHITRHDIGINPEAAVFVDAVALDSAMTASLPLSRTAATALEQALSRYKGLFLEGFHIRHAAPFSDWVRLEQERLEQLALRGLTHLTRFYAERQQPQQALPLAEQLVTLDPLNEEGQRLLMQLLAQTGQASAALAQFETCAALLEAELGVSPAAETAVLRDQIKAGAFDQPAAPPTFPHNLPPKMTSFVGRETELAQIEARLADPTCRLLTVIGQGGVGKTRLLLAAARRQHGRFLDGVWFVPLASLDTPELLETAVADALGFAFSGSVEPRTQLASYLSQKELLLLLDNAEHLLGDHLLGLVQTLLHHAPELRLIISSRERLQLRAEWLLLVDGLPFAPQATAAEEPEAVQLFVQRAQQLLPTFQPQGETLTTIRHIVTLLAGMPLGIELAATTLRYYDVVAIANGIENDLRFLQTSLRDVPPRHRSIQAVIHRSWELLAEEEQAAFAALSTFRGNFAAEAATAVLQTPPAVLFALVDKSLVQRQENGRLQLHNLLRQFAAAKLATQPDQQAVAQGRHAAFYAELLQQWGESLKNGRQLEALAAIQADIENIRAAWQHAQTLPRTTPELLPLLANALEALFHFFSMRSWFREGVTLFNQAVLWLSPPDNEQEQALQARLRARYGWFAFLLGEQEVGEAALRQSLAVLEAQQETADLIFVHNYLGVMAFYQRRMAEAKSHLTEALRLAAQTGDRYGEAIGLNILGVLHLELAAYEQAESYLRDSLALKRAIGDRWGIAFSLEKLGGVQLAFGNFAEAEAHLQESLAIRRGLGDQRGVALCLQQLGDLAMQQQDVATAVSLYGDCLTIFQQIGDAQAMAQVQERLAHE